MTFVVAPSRKPAFWAEVDRLNRAEKKQSKPDDYEAMGGDQRMHRALHEQAKKTPGAARMVRALKSAKAAKPEVHSEPAKPAKVAADVHKKAGKVNTKPAVKKKKARAK